MKELIYHLLTIRFNVTVILTICTLNFQIHSNPDKAMEDKLVIHSSFPPLKYH